MPARNLGDDFVSSASLWIVNRLLPPLWDGPPPFRGGRATFNHPSMRWAPPSTRPASRVDSRRSNLRSPRVDATPAAIGVRSEIDSTNAALRDVVNSVVDQRHWLLVLDIERLRCMDAQRLSTEEKLDLMANLTLTH